MELITIAIPCNSFKDEYITHAINSVLGQDNKNWQLMLIDGSCSGLTELKGVVASFDHNRITYVRNMGDVSMAGNWNFCLEQASTELVTLLHDDDTLHADYVKKMLAFSKKFPDSAAYYCDVNLIDEKGGATWTVADKVKSFITPKQPITHINSDSGLASLLRGCFIFCPTVCYRKSKIPNDLFSSKWKMVTDFQCYYDLLIAGHTISGMNEKLYNYRRHNKNQTAKLTDNLQRFEEEVDFYSQVYNEIKSCWPKSALVAKKKKIIKLHLGYLMLSNVCQLNFSRVKQLFLFYKRIN